MAKRIQMTGAEFSKMVRVMRGFKSGAASSTALEARDMFYLETGINPLNQAAAVTAYASDGRRAVKVTSNLTYVDVPLKGFMRNPPFIPRSSDTVTITLRGRTLYTTYESYGVTFASPQPSQGKDIVKNVKSAIEAAKTTAAKAEIYLNNGFMADAMKAAAVALAGRPAKVKISVGESPAPILIEAKCMEAIILPQRGD